MTYLPDSILSKLRQFFLGHVKSKSGCIKISFIENLKHSKHLCCWEGYNKNILSSIFFWIPPFLGSMLPQYMALSVSQLVTFVKKELCVRLFGYIVGASRPFENMGVRSLGFILVASPPLWKYVCPFVGFHCVFF